MCYDNLVKIIMLSFFSWSETFNLCIYLFTTARLECLQRCQSSFPTLSCQTRWQNNTFRNIKGVNNNNELFIDTISFNKGQDYCLRQSMPSKVLLPMTGWYFDGLSSVVYFLLWQQMTIRAWTHPMSIPCNEKVKEGGKKFWALLNKKI